MKTNWTNLKLSKDLLFRQYFLKNELKLAILKSLIRNQNIQPMVRSYSLLLLSIKNKKKKNLSIQQNRCLLTGKAKTTLNISGFSRQNTKKFIDLGLLQNIKTNSY